MKHIVVLAIERQIVEAYSRYLREFFSQYAYVEGICISDNPTRPINNADIALLSSELLLETIRPLLPVDTKIIFSNFAFSLEQLEKIKLIPQNSKVLVFDYHYPSALSLINILRQNNSGTLDYFPYWPGKVPSPGPEDMDFIVTPGELEQLPIKDRPIIDIGMRKLDVITLTSIASALGVGNADFHNRILEYGVALCQSYQGINKVLKDRIQLDVVLSNINAGIIIVDEQQHQIVRCNRHVCGLLSNPRNCSAFNTDHIHPFCQQLIRMDHTDNFSATLSEGQVRKNLLIFKQRLATTSDEKLSIIVIRDVERAYSAERALSRKQKTDSYTVKYQFSDIIHRSPCMDLVLNRAKKMAMIDAPILILGETGTGKEMFAQAIHNASARRNHPFIAINCAALPDSLLESELFGYEEGAFTGAKRSGKAGLFEAAQGGTIFLDELGNISTLMQMKLLRVLQEKEIMRIGGSELIPVDARIISATNSDIETLVEQGIFRRDLYFRLNTFSLHLPPLRERKEDIEKLLKQFWAGHDKPLVLEKGVREFFYTYDWPGNVRELSNCVEYMAYMGGESITVQDLPPHMVHSRSVPCKPGREQEKICAEILDACGKVPMGRGRLLEFLHQKGYQVSEYRLREILETLRRDGKILIGKGRGGIRVKRGTGAE